ncbi:MAG: hypothetical protein AAGB15_05980 [Pseudomonadota bacterium]
MGLVGARGRALGYGAGVVFSRVGLPLARPGSAAGKAIVCMEAMGDFDHWLADRIEAMTGRDIGLLITASAAAVVLALIVRFGAIAHGAINGAFGRVAPSMELAAPTFGSAKRRVLFRVHSTIIRGSVLTAAILIFVDTAKELPTTLILRPFNFDTLATTVFHAASLEKLGEAGPSSLAIIAVGLAPVIILARRLNRMHVGGIGP